MKHKFIESIFTFGLFTLVWSSSAAAEAGKILFWSIDESMPAAIEQVTVKDLVKAGIESWSFYTETLYITPAENYSLNGKPMPATVVINLGDTENNVAVSATQGGPQKIPVPGKTPLKITLNKNFKWNVKTFLSAITHGMGHVLGLNISRRENDIMNLASVSDGLVDPSASEVELITKLWKEAPSRRDIRTDVR